MIPIRVLCVVPNLRICNGMASYAMNYFTHIDKEKVKMDFLVLHSIPSPYEDVIKQAGSQIFVLPPLKQGIFKYLKVLDNVFKTKKYDIIHCNVMNTGAIILKYAKKNGINVRILHSHATKLAEVKWKEIRNDAIAPITKYYSTEFFACSRLAGNYLFGDAQYHVINNAIDESNYIYNEIKKEIILNKLGIGNNFVIGTVGRYAPQKNPLFLIDIFAELKKKCGNAKLLWVGSGIMEKEIKDRIDMLKLDDDVILLGDRSDVHDLYQAMDVFLLPSLYEGLPVVGIEAQCAGLPILASDTITKEMKITNLVTFLSIKESAEKWAEVILSSTNKFIRSNVEEDIYNSGYSIKNEAKHIEVIYNDLIKGV